MNKSITLSSITHPNYSLLRPFTWFTNSKY